MFTRGCTFRSPYLRFFFDGDAGGAGGGGGGDGLGAENAPKFPANTPVKDMKPEEQAAYWQDKARKHEDRVRKYGDMTPEKIAELRQERDDLLTKGQTAEEKAVEEAKEAGRAEIRQELAKERLKSALKDALSGRVPDAGALLELDRSTLVKKDGTVDSEALKTWVEANSTEAGKPGKKAPDLGGGRREDVTKTPGERGRSEAARRFKKNKTD